MLDHVTRPLVDPLLNKMAATLHRSKVRADQVTFVAFIAGLLAMILIALGQPLLGLALFALNRTLDGLDGAPARCGRPRPGCPGGHRPGLLRPGGGGGADRVWPRRRAAVRGGQGGAGGPGAGRCDDVRCERR